MKDKIKFKKDLDNVLTALERYSNHCTATLDENNVGDLYDVEFFKNAKIFTNSLSDNIVTKIFADKYKAVDFYQNVRNGKESFTISSYLSICFDHLLLINFCREHKDEIESRLDINRESVNWLR